MDAVRTTIYRSWVNAQHDFDRAQRDLAHAAETHERAAAYAVERAGHMTELGAWLATHPDDTAPAGSPGGPPEPVELVAMAPLDETQAAWAAQ